MNEHRRGAVHQKCGRCIARKTLPQRSAYLSHITSSGQMDLVCIDFLSIEADSKGICNVLVITNHFTHYAQAYPARDQKALNVAKILVEKFFVHHGLPAGSIPTKGVILRASSSKSC